MDEIKVGILCYIYMYRYVNSIYIRIVCIILILLFNFIVIEIFEVFLVVFVFKNNLFLRYFKCYLYFYDNNI